MDYYLRAQGGHLLIVERPSRGVAPSIDFVPCRNLIDSIADLVRSHCCPDDQGRGREFRQCGQHHGADYSASGNTDCLFRHRCGDRSDNTPNRLSRRIGIVRRAVPAIAAARFVSPAAKPSGSWLSQLPVPGSSNRCAVM